MFSADKMVKLVPLSHLNFFCTYGTNNATDDIVRITAAHTVVPFSPFFFLPLCFPKKIFSNRIQENIFLIFSPGPLRGTSLKQWYFPLLVALECRRWNSRLESHLASKTLLKNNDGVRHAQLCRGCYWNEWLKTG